MFMCSFSSRKSLGTAIAVVVGISETCSTVGIGCGLMRPPYEDPHDVGEGDRWARVASSDATPFAVVAAAWAQRSLAAHPGPWPSAPRSVADDGQLVTAPAARACRR